MYLAVVAVVADDDVVDLDSGLVTDSGHLLSAGDLSNQSDLQL